MAFFPDSSQLINCSAIIRHWWRQNKSFCS